MKCYYHNDREVIAACTECGRFICEECKVNINGKAVCKSCVENNIFSSNQRNKYNTYNYGEVKQQEYNKYYGRKYMQKSWLVTLLLCLFTGTLGVHRFYVGKIGTGILQLLTFGGFGIWTLVDFILIACKKFTDAKGDLILD